MSKQKQITLDELPKPGEPLKIDIADVNRAVVAEDIQEKLAQLSGKLTRRDLFWTRWRYKRLWNRLNRVGYNELCSQRWDLKQQIEKLAEQFKAAKGKERRERIRKQGLELAKAGRELHERIKKLQPFADEFDALGRKLRLHEIAVSYEKEDAENYAALKTEARNWEALLYAAFRQNGRIHHRGTDRKGNEFIDTPIIEKIDITDDRVYYKIQLTSQSWLQRLFGRFSSALPYDVDINDLTNRETLDNLSASCGRIVTIERGKRDTNLYYVVSRLDSPDGIPAKVPYAKVIEWYPIKDQAKTPWLAGVTRDRKVEAFNFEDNPHVMIAGTTLSGKSNHLNQMISTLVNLNRPSEVRILLVDNKGGVEFVHWAGIKHALRPMIKKASDVLPTLKWIRELMERRLSTFERIKAKNFMAYNAKVKDESRIPRIIVFIDELATLLGMDETEAIQNEFRAISSQGRAVGVHLVICTQHVSVDVLPGWIKTNMALRVSGFMPTDSASRVILDHGAAHTMPAIPGRMVFSVGTSWFYAQSPFITDGEIESAVEKSKNDPDPDNREFESAAPLVPREKFSRQDMLTIALTKLGGKLSAKRIYELLESGLISRGNLEKMIAEVIAEGPVINHCGETFEISKVRNWFEIHRASNQLSEDTDFPEESILPEAGKVGT